MKGKCSNLRVAVAVTTSGEGGGGTGGGTRAPFNVPLLYGISSLMLAPSAITPVATKTEHVFF